MTTMKITKGTEIRIRPARAEDRFAMARIIIGATFSAFHGRVPDKCLDWLEVEESATNWGASLGELPDHEHLLVAEVQGVDVVGLILAGGTTVGKVSEPIADRYPREITSLQISLAWQRRGLGRRLIQEAAGLLYDGDDAGLLVRVLADNPNVEFYRALGGVDVGSQPYDWNGYGTSELLLGWQSIRELCT